MSRTRPQPVTLHGVALPDADQPDLTGSLSRVRLHHIVIQPAAGLVHLCAGRAGNVTYCGAYHPQGVHKPGGIWGNGRLFPLNLVRGVFSRRDDTRDRLAYRVAWQGRELSPCSDCLSMAACESTMVASSRYPVVRLTDQLAALPDDQEADRADRQA